MQLASRFASRSPVLRSTSPLSEEQIAAVAPSIFAIEAHDSRSSRYAYIPTIEVLRGLRKEGFEPFFVCQTRVRDEARREFTKHMVRLRHAGEISGAEANEVILLNSHDGSSSYQMLAGLLRFVCQNGLVCGETMRDVRVPHKGNIVGQVIEGAYEVLDTFEAIAEQREGMKSLSLSEGEQHAFARAALTLKYDEETPAPITEMQLLTPRRIEDRGSDLWHTLNTVQEHLTKGGLHGRGRNGRRATTRPVHDIDQNIKLNRALWVLAEEMRRLRSH